MNDKNQSFSDSERLSEFASAQNPITGVDKTVINTKTTWMQIENFLEEYIRAAAIPHLEALENRFFI